MNEKKSKLEENAQKLDESSDCFIIAKALKTLTKFEEEGKGGTAEYLMCLEIIRKVTNS